jgi:hypothetical protein
MISETSKQYDRNAIRHIVVIGACLVLVGALTSSSPAQESGEAPEQIVDLALSPKSTVIYTGWMRKQLAPLGDAAAVAITKELAGKRPQADIVDRVLLIIEFAFDSTETIANQADQKPKTALFVLAFLNQQALSTDQRKNLHELRMKLKTLASDPESWPASSKPKP